MRDLLNRVVGHGRTAPNRDAITGDFGAVTYGALAGQIARTAAWAETLPTKVALLAPRDARWIVWYLGLAWAGRTVVPLPEFFAPAQLAHIVTDAGVEVIVCADEMLERAALLGLPTAVPHLDLAPSARVGGEPEFIIYTSGTSGRPKGVRLQGSQLAFSVQAMVNAVEATADDRMLSVLPQALLLEQIAGILAPLSVGASIVICPNPFLLPMTAETVAPTASVLVPEVLTGWVRWLEAAGRPAPSTLRFVAVGGAPVPKALAERAWAVGLPVYEGYGLSECCSVVAVNRPGRRQTGTVGQPLNGVGVSIDGGEIIVTGPTVMTGYLGGTEIDGRYPTGDAGHFDTDGNLIVDGRIDDVVVTALGRNIHPEWIESMLLSDYRIGRCAVVRGDSHPWAVLVPANDWLATASQVDIRALVEDLCAEAPAYARPSAFFVMHDAELRNHELITSNGRLRRRAIAAFLEDRA